MPLVEVNFDGIVGPSHNYAGLSPGNLASGRNKGAVSHPRAAALQGVAKMRHNLALGLPQGVFLPHPRPDRQWLASLATDASNAEAHLLAQSLSASAMWAANAATVSPAPDTLDGKCHLSAANLVTMPHRSHEWPETLRQLRIAFGSEAFVVHGPAPAPFGDEGAANHMRLCASHAEPGVGVFVYGERGGPFPARQHLEASKAVARAHGVRDAIFVQQSEAAIAAGAFHNDVVAVANENVLFAHDLAFADKARLFDQLAAKVPGFQLVEVPASAVSLADAIKSYLFNAQLVTLPTGGMGLILPTDAQDVPAVWGWLQRMIAGNGPIRRLLPVDVRESMANGGGPACLRLRVVCDPGTVDPRFMVDAGKLDAIAAVISTEWPEAIAPAQLNDLALHAQLEKARESLFETLDLTV